MDTGREAVDVSPAELVAVAVKRCVPIGNVTGPTDHEPAVVVVVLLPICAVPPSNNLTVEVACEVPFITNEREW